MNGRFLLYILTCGPLAIALAAWIRLYRAERKPRHTLALLALGIASANATLACGTVLYYQFRTSANFLPAWQDPKLLQLALLGLLAPIAMTLAIVAGIRGAPKWVVGIVQIVSLPLFLVGIMASNTV